MSPMQTETPTGDRPFSFERMEMVDFESSGFLLDKSNGGWVKMPSEILTHVKSCMDCPNGGQVDKELMPLVENDLLKGQEDDNARLIMNKGRRRAFFNPRLHVSNRCNMACGYCHVFGNKHLIRDGQTGSMGFEVMKSAFDAFLKLAGDEKTPVFQFGFYGGEPLLNWKAVKKAIIYGNGFFKGKAEVQWILNTNGTLITAEIAKILSVEGVDVHISIDGATESSNENRKYKSGRPTLKRVLDALSLLKRHNCRVQFDSCLTKDNLNQLPGLIDLAETYGADRIYLALTDTPESGKSEIPDAALAAEKLLHAMRYAESKQIVLGGPWKIFYPWFAKKENLFKSPVPHLVVEHTGEFYFPAFPEKKIGQIKDLPGMVNSDVYMEAVGQLKSVSAECKGCVLESVCNGYLKGMVRYHTGSFEGSRMECGIARAVFREFLGYLGRVKPGKLPGGLPVRDLTLLYAGFTHSRHLWVRKTDGSRILVHGESGISLEVSEDTLEFISCFQRRRKPVSLLDRYRIPNIIETLDLMERQNLLIQDTRDEELEILEKRSLTDGKEMMESDNCICLFPAREEAFSSNFLDAIQKLYLRIDPELRHSDKKIILYLCRSRDEISRFWMEPHLPDWVTAFVSHRRILVADPACFRRIDMEQDKAFTRGMTHELIHIILGQMNVNLPVWAEEGVCEYFSKPNPDRRLLTLMARKRLFSLDELESKVRHNLLDLDNARTENNICYHQSHSFMAYLFNRFGKSGMIQCIQNTGLVTDFRQSFLKQFGLTIEEMEKEWRCGIAA